MKHYDFKVVLEPDPDDGYVISCPAIPGCRSQGNTVEEALRNIHEAIVLCLEDMLANNEELPNPSHTLMGTVGVDI